jgi:hypothetical protein
MIKPLVVKETTYKDVKTIERTYTTYAELKELFGGDIECLAYKLVERCEELEEHLRADDVIIKSLEDKLDGYAASATKGLSKRIEEQDAKIVQLTSLVDQIRAITVVPEVPNGP